MKKLDQSSSTTKTEDGTPLTGTVVGDESKTEASGMKDVDNGEPGTEYNTADNGMKLGTY